MERLKGTNHTVSPIRKIFSVFTLKASNRTLFFEQIITVFLRVDYTFSYLYCNLTVVFIFIFAETF